MRLRCMMAPSDVEHQLKFLVYTLDRASELADQSGVAWMSMLFGHDANQAALQHTTV